MSLARTAPPPAMFQQSLGARKLALTASLCAYTSRPPSRPRLLVPAVIAQSQTENRGILTKSPGDFSRTAPICLSGHAAQDAPRRILSGCSRDCRGGILERKNGASLQNPLGIFPRRHRFACLVTPPRMRKGASLAAVVVTVDVELCAWSCFPWCWTRPASLGKIPPHTHAGGGSVYTRSRPTSHVRQPCESAGAHDPAHGAPNGRTNALNVGDAKPLRCTTGPPTYKEGEPKTHENGKRRPGNKRHPPALFARLVGSRHAGWQAYRSPDFKPPAGRSSVDCRWLRSVTLTLHTLARSLRSLARLARFP